MRHSEIELFLDDVSDEDESCSEFEDNVEEADSSNSSSGESETALVPVEIITSKNGQLTYSKNYLETVTEELRGKILST